MQSNDTNTTTPAHVCSTAELGERTCEQGCNGCDDCTDYDDGDYVCPCCDGDGRDPMTDYVLECPLCGGGDAS
jgi:hypothetical protein